IWAGHSDRGTNAMLFRSDAQLKHITLRNISISSCEFGIVLSTLTTNYNQGHLWRNVSVDNHDKYGWVGDGDDWKILGCDNTNAQVQHESCARMSGMRMSLDCVRL